MKNITRSRLYGAMTTLIVTAALAFPAAAQQQVPLKGNLQGNDSDNFTGPTTVVVTSTGTGNATHLGLFLYKLVGTVNLLQGTETGTLTLTAANGDMIFATIVGSGAATSDPNVISITETATITGGTGRFEGAQGTFTIQRLGNGATFTTAGTFDGEISSPGALH